MSSTTPTAASADIEDARRKTIISASRRTDIPAAYMAQYEGHFRNGFIDVKQPRKANASRVSLRPNDVAAVVWWSKNYGPWLTAYRADETFWRQWQHFFQFTLNPPCPLEPRVPGLSLRLQQLAVLAGTFGPERVKVRFDPILRYRRFNAPLRDDLPDGGWLSNTTSLVTAADAIPSSPLLDERDVGVSYVEVIFRTLARLGIREVRTKLCEVTSRPKVVARLKKTVWVVDEVVDPEERGRLIERLCEVGERHGVAVVSCADLELYAPRLMPGACISGEQIGSCIGVTVTSADGQTRPGCLCTKTVDIGQYDMACPNGCLYCYANPAL